MFRKIYRISDAGNEKKVKLAHATRMHCLDNFLSVFGPENLVLIADNCSQETLSEIKQRSLPQIMETLLGNSGASLYAMTYAIDNFSPEDIVYFVEDDFLHLPNSLNVLLEGMEISDYVTLYDCPDKYMNHSEGGPNSFIEEGGEVTKVLLTPSSHWKYTNSTVMTFATKVKNLQQDFAVWKEYPAQSFIAWQILQKISPDSERSRFRWIERILGRRKYFGWQNRKLISPIPGLSTHAELAFLGPLVDWSQV